MKRHRFPQQKTNISMLLIKAQKSIQIICARKTFRKKTHTNIFIKHGNILIFRKHLIRTAYRL